ncbi:hypothetical protein [Thermotoga profunda]|uniref:hypothetical protein n=1 Tax=Thermotoga profunda TaxID=1508420 RepID=UPI0005976B85|nr:hypothetical protein [Thermotoga profunda]
MKKGEKVLSFVKFEKEIESAYRERLSNTKRPEETGDVFLEFAIGLLSKVNPQITRNHIDQIYFEPESENGYRLSPNLEKILGEEVLKKSDITAILKRMALNAAHRRKTLIADNERTNLFRMQERPDQR